MRRVLLAGLLLLVGLTLTYGYLVTRQERVFRQLVAEGDAAMARGDTYRAVHVFGDAILRKPGSMVGYLKRGAAYRTRGDFTAAATDLETAARIDPMSPRALELLGDVELARAAYDQAAGRFQASLALDDRSARVLYKLGLAQHLAGADTSGCDALTRAVALDSRHAEAYYLLGVCLHGEGRPADAEHALRRAKALAPALLPAREQLADLYRSQGRRLARIAEMEQLLTTDDRPARHVGVADAYAAAGQTLRAVRLLRRTIGAYPDHAGAHLALGRIWLDASEQGRDGAALSAAIAALEQAVAIEASGEALTALGQAYVIARRPAAAETAFARAARVLPIDPPILLHLADAAERGGRTAAARDALVDYVALAAESSRAPGARQRIGDLSMQLGQPAVAAGWYARAADGPSITASLLVKLADAHRQTGDIEAARAALARALERDPEHAGVRRLERQLR